MAFLGRTTGIDQAPEFRGVAELLVEHAESVLQVLVAAGECPPGGELPGDPYPRAGNVWGREVPVAAVAPSRQR